MNRDDIVRSSLTRAWSATRPPRARTDPRGPRRGSGAGTTLFDALIPSLEQVGAALSAGVFVIDLAVQVSPEKVVEKILEHEPDIVGFSAFMPMFKADIDVLQKAGLRDQVIVMVAADAAIGCGGFHDVEPIEHFTESE